MSVYHVYTKTAHIPTYLVYKCQKCQTPVAVLGYYDVSDSYTDRGTFTRKGVAKRESASAEKLKDMATQQTEYLRRSASQVYDDYGHIQCQCPKCGNPSLGKLGNKAKISRMIMLIAAIALMAFVVISMLASKFDISILLGGVIFTLVGAGIIGGIADAVLNAVEKAQMKKISEEAAPLMCSNREILMKAAKKQPAFQDTDFSTIMNTPEIL